MFEVWVAAFAEDIRPRSVTSRRELPIIRVLQRENPRAIAQCLIDCTMFLPTPKSAMLCRL